MKVWLGLLLIVKRCGLALLVACLCGPVLSQSAPSGIRVIEPLDEEWGPPLYSGAWFLGMQLPKARGHDALVTVTIPAELTDTELCLRVNGANGFYRAWQSFVIPAPPAIGQTSLPYATTHIDAPQDVRRLPPDDVVTRVTRGRCTTNEAAENPVVVLSAWRSAAAQGPVLLYLQSAPDDRLVAAAFDAADAAALGEDGISCTGVKADRRAFTHICQIEADRLSLGPHELRIRRYRASDDGPRETFRLTLWIAP